MNELVEKVIENLDGIAIIFKTSNNIRAGQCVKVDVSQDFNLYLKVEEVETDEKTGNLRVAAFAFLKEIETIIEDIRDLVGKPVTLVDK